MRGDLGAVQAVGTVVLQPPRLGSDSLDLHFQDIDLSMISGQGMSTRLQGHALVTILTDTLTAPEGTIQLTMDSSRIREFQLDSVRADLAIADSVIQLDTLEVKWGNEENGGRVSGSGTLGWVQAP